MNTNQPNRPFIRPFDAAEPYTQDEPGDARFNWLVKKGELANMAVGRVRLKGPIKKTPAAHDSWDQAYIILSGKATMLLGEERHPINGPTMITIPRHTHHSIEVEAGDEVEYAFVNVHDSI